MKNFRLLITALAFITLFSACKKDDAPIKPKTKAEMISSTSGKKWKLVASTMSLVIPGKPTETEDMLEDYEPCELDNLSILFADKKYEEKEGATKCDPSDSDLIGSGTWDLRNNDTEFVITSDGDSFEYKVVEITETTIKVEDSLPLANGAVLVFTETYRAQ
jgi:hypothetical protein